MSQSSNTDVTQLRCSICSGFLSCSPVRLLPDGTFICGQCSPANNDLSIHRAQAHEILLEKASFPCCFAQRGCIKRLPFDQTVEHKLKCEYRSFKCPFIRCSWKGSTSEMFKHFTEAHQEQVSENATLKLEVNQNTDGVVTVFKENIAFVIKYQYFAKSTNFSYDIRFCKSDSVCAASYRLQLINNSDSEYTISLKTVDCSVYDYSFRSNLIAQRFNLDKFLQCLDHPTSVLISMHFTIYPKNNDYKDKLENELLLDSLKCKKCRNYLIPPLFQLNKNMFCSDCADTNENYLPLNDKKLLETLNTTMFPCRWRNCKFVTNNKNLRKHQLECQFRQYNCFWDCDCNTFTLASAANHYKEEHKCQYIDKEISFEMSFAEWLWYTDCDIFTIKKHTIIDLEYLVLFKTDNCKIIKFSLYSSDESIIAGSIHFEHQHCKVKSDSFEITKGTELKITLDILPTCFKEKDVLTCFLTI